MGEVVGLEELHLLTHLAHLAFQIRQLTLPAFTGLFRERALAQGGALAALGSRLHLRCFSLVMLFFPILWGQVFLVAIFPLQHGRIQIITKQIVIKLTMMDQISIYSKTLLTTDRGQSFSLEAFARAQKTRLRLQQIFSNSFAYLSSTSVIRSMFSQYILQSIRNLRFLSLPKTVPMFNGFTPSTTTLVRQWFSSSTCRMDSLRLRLGQLLNSLQNLDRYPYKRFTSLSVLILRVKLTKFVLAMRSKKSMSSLWLKRSILFENSMCIFLRSGQRQAIILRTLASSSRNRLKVNALI